MATKPKDTAIASCWSLREVRQIVGNSQRGPYHVVHPFPSLFLCSNSTVVIDPTKLTKYDAIITPDWK